MFRVTMSQSLAFSQLELTRRGAAAAKLQADLATGLRIRRPSDDPRGQQVVLGQQAQLLQLTTRLSSINQARTQLNNAQSQLLDVQGLFVQAKTLAMQGRQSTEPSERDTLATQIDRILDSLIQLANSTHDGQSLFAGADTSVTPFQKDPVTDAVNYHGSTIPARILLNGAATIDVGYSGSEIFMPGGRGATMITGNTGAVAGTGTSSATGTRQLLVKHTSTLFAPGSGVQAGASSSSGDTILGPSGSHQLTIEDVSGTGAFGRVSLNGGPAIDFTSSDTNLPVTGPDGEVVYLDLSQFTAGFSGAVDLTGQGTLSVDGGLTETPVDFSGNQAIVDSRDGSIVYIDSQGIRRAGEETVEFSGTMDAFQILARLCDELRNVDGLSAADLDDSLARRLGDLDRFSTHLLTMVGDQSASLEQLDRLQTRAEDLQLQVQQVITDTQSTDYASTTIALQEQQTWSQFTLATIVRMFDVSVLNYL